MRSTLSLVGLMALAVVPDVQAQGGFAQSCSKLSMVQQYLYASCKTNDGSTRNTREDLNLCVGNEGGNLVAQDNGGFFGSCDSCVIEGESTLNCYCTGSGVGAAIRTIDLNTFVLNQNGFLFCFNHESAPTS